MNNRLTRKEYNDLMNEARDMHYQGEYTDTLMYKLYLALQTTITEYDIEHDSVLYDLMNRLDNILQYEDEYEREDDEEFYEWLNKREREEA